MEQGSRIVSKRVALSNVEPTAIVARMQLNEDKQQNVRYQIQAYKAGEIIINENAYRESLILTNDELITPWSCKDIGDITEKDIDQLLNLPVDIILIGTGNTYKIPPQHLRQFDCMETGAACRTFVALTSEGRRVAAVLLINKG